MVPYNRKEACFELGRMFKAGLITMSEMLIAGELLMEIEAN